MTTRQSAHFQGLEETCAGASLSCESNKPASNLKSVAPLTKESIGKQAHRCGKETQLKIL